MSDPSLKKVYAAIWTGARDLGWSREDVHGMAAQWFERNVTSLTELSEWELSTMIDRMRQSGFRRRKGFVQDSGTDHKLENTIKGLWRRLHSLGAVDDPSPGALAGWVGRQVGAKDGGRVLLRTLDARQQSKIVAALQVWLRRVKKDGQHDAAKQVGGSEDAGCRDYS